MSIIEDKELGKITIKTFNTSRSIRLIVKKTGELILTCHPLTSKNLLLDFVDSNRESIKKLISKNKTAKEIITEYNTNFHSLEFVQSNSIKNPCKITQSKIFVFYKQKEDIKSEQYQELIRKSIVATLKQEAKNYLPQRVEYLAKINNFTFKEVKINSARSHWGTCNRQKTINLSLYTMNLSLELIDYVILHELTHTIHMNHSIDFYNHLDKVCGYRHRELLKKLKQTKFIL